MAKGTSGIPPNMEDFMNENFDAVANSPHEWFMQSQKLWFCASIILEICTTAKQEMSNQWAEQKDASSGDAADKEAEQYPRPISKAEWAMMSENTGLMLLGMAFECLMKSILIARADVPAAKMGVYKPPAGHDLVEMANLIDDSMNTREIELLRVLTECVLWRGRYPTAKRVSVISSFYSFTETEGSFLWYGADKDHNDDKVILALYHRLAQLALKAW